MPKRTDIKTILILGSGPIVIGQGCEFDYSGTQACKALRREGFRVVLVNSNPATIMTDPEFSDRTYIEPITPAAVTKVIELQAEIGDPIQAVLPTLGGQTALNCACALFDDGTLEKHGIEMIGANRHVIHRAEDRAAFNQVCANVGLRVPESRTVSTLAEAREFLETIGLPAIIRPAFTLGGSGGGIAYNTEEFDEIVTRGLRLSMIKQVQVDRSLLGWKEYELEVVRDKRDNCIVVCGIENFDPMGVHTGDSITFAPIMTLTDKEYQVLRDASFAIMREVGVETGGSNVQFAVNPNPEDGKFEFVVVEMNPRVSRSSALASKATGFPIAKIAAKLAVGYTLDELRNDITGTTSACFEPSIDYIVTKMPRWTFEKFPEADETLTTQMKSVGEAMSIGRTLTESLQKAIRSMEVKRFGLGLDRNDDWLEAQRADKDEEGVPRRTDGSPIEWPIPEEKLSRKLTVPSQGRLYYIRYAMKMGWSIERINGLSKIDPFFLDQIKRLVEFEDELCACDSLEEAPREMLFRAKQMGYSDAQLANLYLGTISSDTILKVRAHRKSLGIEPVYKLVDTCAAEFEAVTPYYYSTYERGVERHEGTEARSHEVEEAADAHSSSVPSCLRASVSSPDDEIRVTDRKKVIILGGGPNRIGQGIEFDYCCVHAAFAAKELGFESVMINSNPETVSTDYDTSDLLFFEPLTLEDVLNVVERLNNLQGSLVSPFIELSDAVADRMQKAWRESGLGPGVVITASGFSPEDGFDGHGWSHFVVTSDGVIHDVCIYAASGETTVHRPSEAWLQRVAELSDDPDDDGNLEQWRVEAARMCSGRVHGLIVQFGGQTPLNLAHGLARAGAPIIGTSLDSIDLAEDRDRFDKLLTQLNLQKPPSGIARSVDEAVEIAGRITYPVLVRPSYVLGGRGMEICSDEKALRHYMATAVDISELDNAPVLIDKFLDRATEVDVDVVADFDPSGRHEGTKTRRHEDGAGENDTAGSSSVPSCLSASVPSSVPSCLRASVPSPQAIVCGVMEHIEQAGIHSGDSACTTPPWSLNEQTEQEIRRIARRLAEALRVNGLMNVQMAVRQNDNGSGEADEIYILEVNPRASRTAPFVGKAKHVPWPRIAARAMMGVSLAEQNVREVRDTGAFAVKESVFPFSKFPGVDVVLGPEMRSTGEVMGIDASLPIAFAKSQFGAGVELPLEGAVFVSVHERDRQEVTGVARLLTEMGFTLYATDGTAAHLEQHGISANVLQKIASGARPNVIDLMSDGAIQLVINTPTKTGWQTDEGRIRAGATRLGIPMITTMTGALAVAKAIYALRERGWGVKAMQDYAAESGGPVVSVAGRGQIATPRSL